MSNRRLSLFSILLFVVFFFTLSEGKTAQDSFPELFKAGTQFYQAKDYEKARLSFEKALAKDPSNATALTNLALAQYQLKHKGLAIGLFRKALEINPDLGTAEAGLQWALAEMDIKEIPHQIETYESLRSRLLQPVSLSTYLIFTAFLLFAAGWTWLAFLGQRRRSAQEESAPPPLPWLGFIFSVGFLLSLSFLSLKIYDSQQIRGTIIDDKVSLQSAPGADQVPLLDLYGGFEVITHESSEDWVQVTYPGSLTGWIKKSSLLITSHPPF